MTAETTMPTVAPPLRHQDRPRREADMRRPEDRKHPWMWADYEKLPASSLSLDMIDTRIVAPYCVTLRFFSRTQELMDNCGWTDGGLVGRGILPDDLLVFDYSRTEPQDDVIMLVQDGDESVARVCTVLADGWVEFHATEPGYPVLSGERKIWGTLAAVVRATDGKAEPAE